LAGSVRVGRLVARHRDELTTESTPPRTRIPPAAMDWPLPVAPEEIVRDENGRLSVILMVRMAVAVMLVLKSEARLAIPSADFAHAPAPVRP
jgi:hypothetical protein